MRAEFFGRMKKLLSAQSARALAQTGAAWKFAPPADREEFMNEFKERLQQQLDTDWITDARVDALTPVQKQAFLGLVINQASREPLDETRELCKEKMPVENDHALSSSNRFHLSGVTAAQPRFAKRVAFHEYAHMASNFLAKNKNVSKESRKWYGDSLKCLNDQRGDKQKFEEEDFAAMVSGALAWDSDNNQCSVAWSADDAEYFTLADSPQDTLHSGPIYLMLLEHMSSGRTTPEICATGLAAKGEAGLPKNCTGRASTR
jgi:hypothetical protein